MVEKVDINILNRLIGNKEALYNHLIENNNLYLPKLHSRAMTSEYLMGIIEDKYFTLKRDVTQHFKNYNHDNCELYHKKQLFCIFFILSYFMF